MSGQLTAVEDPRSGFEKFRRRELYAIAKAENITFDQGCPATSIVIMLNDRGVDPFKYQTQSKPLSQGGDDRIQIPKEFLGTEDTVVEEIEPLKLAIEDVYLDQMSWKDLMAWCKDHGVKKELKDTKKTLLAKAKARLDG